MDKLLEKNNSVFFSESVLQFLLLVNLKKLIEVDVVSNKKSQLEQSY